MSRAIHFLAKGVPGYGPPDLAYLPCDGVSAKAVCVSPYPSRAQKANSLKAQHLRCTIRNASLVCSASSGSHRRNSDFSRQNKHGFSRKRNWQNEDRDGFDSLDESEMFSSKNGPVLTSSGISRFQATATPGPREKEIVELFRKVQAQLRERAAAKEERKVEDSKKKGKESETVDSLLKLLRKHSVQQGKRSTEIDRSGDFIVDHPEQNGPLSEERSTLIHESKSTAKHEKQASEAPVVHRPRSNFQRRSPVPPLKAQPIFSDEDAIQSVSLANSDKKRKDKVLDPGLDVEPEKESERDPAFSDDDVFGEVSEDEISGIYDDDDDDNGNDSNSSEQNAAEHNNLSEMKLTELRALAKSRGVRGFSKLKKHELVELLGGA